MPASTRITSRSSEGPGRYSGGLLPHPQLDVGLPERGLEVFHLIEQGAFGGVRTRLAAGLHPRPRRPRGTDASSSPPWSRTPSLGGRPRRPSPHRPGCSTRPGPSPAPAWSVDVTSTDSLIVRGQLSTPARNLDAEHNDPTPSVRTPRPAHPSDPEVARAPRTRRRETPGQHRTHSSPDPLVTGPTRHRPRNFGLGLARSSPSSVARSVLANAVRWSLMP
jgi:hypothetical protein